MWWSDRIPRAAALLLTLASCGFTPLYGAGSSGRALEGRVVVGQLPGALGFALREQLTFRLGPVRNPAWALEVDTDVTARDVAVAQFDTTRITLTGVARYRLTPRKAGTARHGKVRAFAAYSVTGSPYAERVARRDAEKRLAITLANRIVSRLALPERP